MGPGESLRAAVAVNLSEEPAKEALDYEVLALVDEVEEEIKTTAAAALATEAPVVRKVFFEIVDSSAGEKAENPKVAPTLAAIPEAISADPVFQEITRDATANEQQKRGFRAYDPRQSQVYAHKYNDANRNWYYFRGLLDPSPNNLFCSLNSLALGWLPISFMSLRTCTANCFLKFYVVGIANTGITKRHSNNRKPKNLALVLLPLPTIVNLNIYLFIYSNALYQLPDILSFEIKSK